MRRESADWMPWASGPRPVAIVVQTMAGTRSGSARSLARAPEARRAPSARHLAAGDEVLGHAPLEPVDREDTHAQAGRHHGVVGGLGACRAREPWRHGHDDGEERGRAQDEREDAPAREAGGRQVRGGAARREDGHRRERGEAAEGEAQQEAEPERRRLAEERGAREVGAAPQRDVGDRDEGHREAHVSGEARTRLPPEPPRPRGEEAARERGYAGDEDEGDHEVEGEDDEVLWLGEEAPVETGRRQGRGQAEEDAAHEADAPGRAQRRAERRRPARPAEDEPVERAVEVAEPLQLLAHRVDGGEGRPNVAHQGRQPREKR